MPRFFFHNERRKSESRLAELFRTKFEETNVTYDRSFVSPRFRVIDETENWQIDRNVNPEKKRRTFFSRKRISIRRRIGILDSRRTKKKIHDFSLFVWFLFCFVASWFSREKLHPAELRNKSDERTNSLFFSGAEQKGRSFLVELCKQWDHCQKKPCNYWLNRFVYQCSSKSAKEKNRAVHLFRLNFNGKFFSFDARFDIQFEFKTLEFDCEWKKNDANLSSMSSWKRERACSNQRRSERRKTSRLPVDEFEFLMIRFVLKRIGLLIVNEPTILNPGDLLNLCSVNGQFSFSFVDEFFLFRNDFPRKTASDLYRLNSIGQFDVLASGRCNIKNK